MSMLTVKDFEDIIEGKIASEAQKAIIRNSVPPQIAEKMCEAIDKNETAKHFERFLKEWNEWILNQQRQQLYIQQFLAQHLR